MSGLRKAHLAVSKVLWVSVMLGAAWGGFVLYVLMLSRELSAPQEASGAAQALAFAGVPYVAARAWDELGRTT